MLPDKKTKPIYKLEKYHWLIYGQQKIGKSTFVSQFPNILFIPTEPGLGALEVYKATDKEYIQTWEEFLDICSDIARAHKEGKLKFNMVAIDTIDNLYDSCLEYTCRKEGIRHPSEGSFGAGWAAVSNELKRVILKLAEMVRIVFISHDTERETEIKKIKIMRTQPTITGGEKGRFITGLVDFIGYVTTDIENSDNRVVYFRGHDALVAGDRTNRLGTTMNFDYKQIKEKFEKGEK